NETLQQLQNADSHEDRQIKMALCLRCAKWYGQELGHPEYAGPYYQQILSLDPTNYAAMQSQADLYRHLGQWQMLAQMLGRMAEIVRGGKERAAVFAQMGELCEEHLGLPEQAPSYYRQAIEADPTNLVAITSLERIYKARSDWPELLDILKLKVAALSDPDEVVEARLAVAEVYELRLER